MRLTMLISASFLLLSRVPIRAVTAQQLTGTFTSPNSGETFDVESNGDGFS